MYAIDDLHAEIAYIAYHFHWPLSEILDLEHGERRRYIRQIGTINQRLAGEDQGLR
ncbi:DUF6760 family protein [Streptomyces sp. NPDC001339]|uniref:DUF6760 family protein n=1 Tax=Streptomyces sp. NPDC001339 TaxID=3364563 RepID=UPI0036BD5653